MKVTKHIERLLRQGRKPRELVALGFPKQVVTKVRRQLKEEKAAQRQNAPMAKAAAKSLPEPSAVSPEPTASVGQRLASIESDIDQLLGRMKTLETGSAVLKDIKDRLDGTPALGLKHRFKCDCGASGFVALRIQCTKCREETWWGWYPKE